MPANLTPEQLAWLQSYYQAPQSSGYQGNLTARAQDPNGDYFNMLYGGHAPQGEASWESNGLTPADAYTMDVIPGKHENGDLVNNYDPSGKFTKQSTLDDTAFRDFIMGVAMMAGPFAAAAGGAGAAAGAAGAGGSFTPAELASFEAGGLGGQGAAGLGTLGTAGATGTMASLPLMAAPETSMLTPYEIGAGTGGAAAAGGVTGTMGTLEPLVASGGASSLTPYVTSVGSGMPSWLGGAASIVGGLLGSKPVQKTTTSQSQIDPRMAPYLYGEDGKGGLMAAVQQRLAASTTPQRQVEADNQRAAGQRLMSSFFR